jgi:F-type H+-transporting ATPase subunit b
VSRPALWVLAIAWIAVPASFAQEAKTAPGTEPRPGRVTRTEEKVENEESRLLVWRWANFLLLAAGIGYIAVKSGGPFFTARSRHIRKDMLEAAEVRKEAEERAAAVDRRLANLAVDIARLKEEAQHEREAEIERLRRHREAERVKIQAHAQREIESAGKAARMELKRYAAVLAVDLAQQKIRGRMNPEVQDVLVGEFVSDLASSSPAAAPGH